MIKLIKNIIKVIFALCIILAIVLVSGYIFIKVKYEIDLIETVTQLKTLSKPVDEKKLCPETFSFSDMLDVQIEINNSVDSMVTYEEDEYKINFNTLLSPMKNPIALTDKQVGILSEIILQQETGGKIEIVDKEVPFEIKQVNFSNISNGGADFNIVVKLDIKNLKDSIDKKIYKYIEKYIPNDLYISSTIRVDKGNEPFSYIINHLSLTINNLSNDDTNDLIYIMDLIFKTGSAQDLNTKLGYKIMGILVGNEEEIGLAYSLRVVGATDYIFSTNENKDYFIIQN